MDFTPWINKKYDLWRMGKRGNASSITQFARLFGASYQLMLKWMNGKSHPVRKKYIDALIYVYEDEAREIFGVASSDEINQIEYLPEPYRSAMKETLTALQERSKTKYSDEEETALIARTIFEKHGFKYQPPSK